jgi:hypothetical protein
MRFLYAALLLAVSCSSALAQREPEIVIPGRPDVPVYINGIDASWGIVEGEFGLDRPNQVNPTVVYRPYLVALPFGVPSYFPREGRRPGYGRLEFVPPAERRPLAPGPRYRRFWSSESDPGPVTEYPGGPPVTYAPTFNGGTQSNQRNRETQSNQRHATEDQASENHADANNRSGSNKGR